MTVSFSNCCNEAASAGSFAASSESSAPCRAFAPALASIKVCRSAASAALLPNVSDNDCASSRTWPLGLLASFAETSSQPAGISISTSPRV